MYNCDFGYYGDDFTKKMKQIKNDGEYSLKKTIKHHCLQLKAFANTVQDRLLERFNPAFSDQHLQHGVGKRTPT